MDYKEFKFAFHYLRRWLERAVDVGWVRQFGRGSGWRYGGRWQREAIGMSFTRHDEA